MFNCQGLIDKVQQTHITGDFYKFHLENQLALRKYAQNKENENWNLLNFCKFHNLLKIRYFLLKFSLNKSVFIYYFEKLICYLVKAKLFLSWKALIIESFVACHMVLDMIWTEWDLKNVVMNLSNHRDLFFLE